MPKDLDIALFRAFVAVVETGSVTNAAKLLNRTQAAVSQQLKRLEESLGVELFVRHHKRIELSRDGERLVSHAGRLLELNDQTFGIVGESYYRGSLRLGIPSDLITSYAPGILRRFAKVWPAIELSLAAAASRDLIEQLDNGELDLTLTTELEPFRPDAEIIASDRLVWVTGSESDAHTRDPLPISLGYKTCVFRPVILDALREAGRDWRFVLEISNQEAQNATVTAGLAVSALLSGAIPDGLIIAKDAPQLPELPRFNIGLYAPLSGLNEPAADLRDHIRAEFATRFPTA